MYCLSTAKIIDITGFFLNPIRIFAPKIPGTRMGIWNFYTHSGVRAAVLRRFGMSLCGQALARGRVYGAMAAAGMAIDIAPFGLQKTKNECRRRLDGAKP